MSNTDKNKNAGNDGHGGGHGEHEHTVQPISVFVKVFAGLILLTIATVATSMFDFGVMNIVIAMAIACAKASLVVVFFMQLKFDDLTNKVTFAAAFVFLAIFILLTGSDLFFRRHVEPLKVAEAAPKGETDQNKLRVSTPALLAKGKALYDVNCVSCHGATGKGDGIAAAALNPKPRNYSTGYWRYGGSPTQLFHTLTVGSPGTAMASFSNLSIEDRYALVHYVRSLSPHPPEDTPETLKVAGLGPNGSGAAAAEKPQVEIPIEMAMEKLETPDQVVIPRDTTVDASSSGAKLFEAQCAKCHGTNAAGAAVMALGVNPGVNLMTSAWSGINAAWTANQGEFVRVVSTGFPGRGMPSMDDFSKEEWASLFNYAKQLTH